ncbi:hypothetical protein D3C71_1081290 [compost metagenome]
MRHARTDHFQTVAKREERRVLAHHEQMQPVALRRRLLHQMSMPEGERIGVHYNRANFFPTLAAALQRATVTLDTLRGILKQHRVVAALGNRPETAAGEALFVTRAGAEKEVEMAARQCGIFHFGQQTGTEICAPQLFINRHTLDDIGSQPRASH